MKLTGTEALIHDATGASSEREWGAGDLVTLDPDHPGFRDAAYRARRNHIAKLAFDYREGDPVPQVDYTDAEQDTWRAVWQSLGPLHERYACAAYRECSEIVRLDRTRVPQLAEVNTVLAANGGFRMLPVAGLVADRAFLGHLGRGVFLSTQYMRHPSRPLYTPEPDAVHELVGHAASFAHPELARMNRAFGEAAAGVDADTLVGVARLYWYTLEFGVVAEAGGVRAVGAGLLSSFGELGRFERDAKLLPWSPDAITATPYDPTNYQAQLFVAPSFARMADDVCTWLASLSRNV